MNVRSGIWRQEAMFLAICFAAASAIPFLSPGGQASFASYGFGAPPLLILAVATVAGAAALGSLRTRGFFAEPLRGPGLARSARLAALLALPAIIADLILRFPATMNIPWPDAWLFYPAIAIPAEAMLHLVPLAFVYAVTGRAGIAILVAAICEPAFQTVVNAELGSALRVFVAGQVLVFGLVELWLFRRHGIVALFSFRLTYYAIWHVLWGQLRLVLFADGP